MRDRLPLAWRTSIQREARSSAYFRPILINGYVDFPVFDELLSSVNEQYRVSNINERHRQIWQKYHSSFVTPQKEFIEQQTQFLKDHIRVLSLRDVAATAHFIRELDPNVDLESLISESIELFVAKVDSLDRQELHMLRMEPELIAKIEERVAAKTKDYSITELFVALAGSDSWNSGSIKHLLKYSEDDFVEWITTEQSDDVIDLLAEFLRRFGNQNEDEKSVVEKLRGALNRVKARSPIDRCRIEYLIEDKKRK